LRHPRKAHHVHEQRQYYHGGRGVATILSDAGVPSRWDVKMADILAALDGQTDGQTTDRVGKTVSLPSASIFTSNTLNSIELPAHNAHNVIIGFITATVRNYWAGRQRILYIALMQLHKHQLW